MDKLDMAIERLRTAGKMARKDVRSVSTNDCQELRECPFCGGEARTIEVARYGSRWGVRCPICGGRMCFYPTESEAIEAWNTRQERTCRITSEEYDDLLDVFTTHFSCGHFTIGKVNMYRYCPKCGAKVIEE